MSEGIHGDARTKSTVEAPTRMGNSTIPPRPKVKARGGEPMKRSLGSGRSTLRA